MVDFASIYQMANKPTVPLEQPIDAQARAMQLQNLANQNQLGQGQQQLQQMDIQKQQMALNDQQVMSKLMQSGKYNMADPDSARQLAKDASQQGASPNAVMTLSQHALDQASKISLIGQQLATARLRDAGATKDKQALIDQAAGEAGNLAMTAKNQDDWTKGLAGIDEKYGPQGVPPLSQKYASFDPQTIGTLKTDSTFYKLAYAESLKTQEGIGPDGKPGFFHTDINGQIPAGWKPIPKPSPIQVNPNGTQNGAYSDRAQNIADGNVPVPTPKRGDQTALQDVADAKKIMLARGEDPINLNGKYAVVHQGQTSFAPGKPNANIIQAINTASDHVNNVLNPAAAALKNGDWQTANKILNAIGVETGGNEKTNFDTIATYLATENARVANGGNVPTLAEIQEARKAYPDFGSNAQIKGAIDISNRIMKGKLNAVEQQHENAFSGATMTDRNLLTPDAVKIFGTYTRKGPPAPGGVVPSKTDATLTPEQNALFKLLHPGQ